jgi:hypothetical protein
LSIALWLAGIGPEQDLYNTAASWIFRLVLTGLVTSMAVNALMTGLIVLKILKVFIENKPTSVERTLGSGSTGGSKLRHVIFIIIESGMALFAVQLVRVVLTCLGAQTESTGPWVGEQLVIGIHQVPNVIIRSFHFYFFRFTDDIYLARASRQQ